MTDTNSPSTILVVDDDPLIRDIVTSTLEVQGYTVIEASDGANALNICKECFPDLIVLDVMMPGIDGDEVCRQVRKMPGGDLVPIVMLTARDSLQAKVDSLAGGADDYLTKPFHYEELHARIRAQLRVRELNIDLQERNRELQEMQQKLIDQERQLLVGQLAGTAAHQLGQPLSAILLNCHLLKSLPAEDEKFGRALESIRADAKRMAELIEKLKTADAGATEGYYEGTDILKIEEDE